MGGGAGKSITLDASANPIDMSGFSGTTAASLASYINGKITADSSLSGKLSASVVSDSTGDYIKFNSLTSTNVKITGTTINDLSALSGNTIISTTSSTKLTDLGSNLNTSLTLNLNYNGTNKTVTLDNTKGDKTIADLAAAISQKTGGDVTASLDEVTGAFKLQTKATGSSTSISVITNYSNSGSSDTTPALSSALKLTLGSSDQGKDANVTITAPGGTATTVTESSNNFTMNNINYRLTSDDPANNTTNLTVTANVDKVFDRIVAFKDKYNALVNKIYTKLTEKKSSDYPPLTDAQKSAMKDSDIQTWNDKAKVGILRNDDRLQNLLSDLRGVFYTPVNGSAMNFGSKNLGLDLSDDVTKPGQLEFRLDNGEQNFKDALRNNGADVMSLFLKSPTSTAKIGDKNYYDTTYKEEGIMNRIQDALTNNVGLPGIGFSTDTKGILTKYANLQDDFSMLGSAGTGTLKDQIYQQTNVIKTLTDKFKDKQEAYYQKFSKLETAMETLNSQQSQLSSLLGQ
ncbi:flagellar hook-associated 2 domain protein [Clostridium carboxidivorans P7]|uniref:Flagellar hook-associated 2 domain protein n=1 Tax=Clostridium carboxidivorans P7 TaxID=536227 RepID=C6PPI8_9CLOT|nr:flagellar filament capping protein FliD [Clostridium carboxidivorans]EET88882.1 flagellar hook-associated 2 domain protein [Clostridium carboxidivorans P7]